MTIFAETVGGDERLIGDGGFSCSIAQIVGPRVPERPKSNTWTAISASCDQVRSSAAPSLGRLFRSRNCDTGASISRKLIRRLRPFCSGTPMGTGGSHSLRLPLWNHRRTCDALSDRLKDQGAERVRFLDGKPDR